LRGVVIHGADLHPGLLADLAHHRVLQAFARLNEAGDGRVTARRPARLPPEQRALAVRHKHDYGRIDAGELIECTAWIAAAKHMAGLKRRRGRAATAAAT